MSKIKKIDRYFYLSIKNYCISSTSDSNTSIFPIFSIKSFIFSSFLYYILVKLPFPAILPVTPTYLPAPQDSHFLISLQKRAGLPGISTKHVKSYNKTRHIAYYQGWSKQPRRRKTVRKVSIRVKDSSCSHCWESHKNTRLH